MAMLRLLPQVGPGPVQAGRVRGWGRPSLSAPLQLRRGVARAASGDGEAADMLLEACPVPKEQQPMQELLAIQNAFLFDWPRLPFPEFAARLGAVFGGFFLFLGLPISCVTFSLDDELVQVVASSAIGSGFITLVLLLRLYVGYSHVSNRLLSATVEYEETGWYDGEVWIKTPQMLMRDRLLGTYQVKPVLDKLKKALLGLSGAMAAAMVLLAAAPPPKAYSAGSSSYAAAPAAVRPPITAVRAIPSTAVDDDEDDAYWRRVAEYEPWAMEGDGQRPASLTGHIVGQLQE